MDGLKILDGWVGMRRDRVSRCSMVSVFVFGRKRGLNVPTYISESTYISHNRSPSSRTKLSFSDWSSVEILKRVLSLQHIYLYRPRFPI